MPGDVLLQNLQEGIYFVDFSKTKKQENVENSDEEIYQDIKLEFRLIRIEIQKAPIDHIKDRKYFKGKLGWHKVFYILDYFYDFFN